MLKFFSPTYLTNALHWYAEIDKGEGDLNKILGKSVYTEDFQGNTPFSLAIKNNSFSAIKDIMIHLAETEKTDFLYLTDFQLLIRHHSNEAMNIADKCFVPSEFINKYPKTLKIKGSKLFFGSNSRILQKSDIMKLEDNKNGSHNQVEFMSSVFKVNTEYGSQESLDLLTAIKEIGNLESFRTILINFVEWKWESVGWLVTLNAVPGFIFTIMTLLDLFFLY